MAGSDLSITSLRGGVNTTDPPQNLPDDQAVQHDNTELFSSALGERRYGCEQTLPVQGSGLDLDGYLVHLSPFYPQQAITAPQIIAVSATPGVQAHMAVAADNSWTPITPLDAISPIVNGATIGGVPPVNVFDITSQDLNAKDFIAYPSAVDRLHVWDGTTLRRTGLAQPNSPTVANTGSVVAPTLVAHVAAASTTGNGMTSAPVNSTGATFMVAVVADFASVGASTFIDNMGNNWVPLQSRVNGVNTRITIWIAPGTNVGPGHTFTVPSSGTAPSFCVECWAGVLLANNLDQVDSTSSASVGVTSLPTGGVTPQFNSELLIAGLANGTAVSGWSVDTGFALGDTNVLVSAHCFGSAIAWLLQSTQATVNPVWTWTTSDPYVCAAIATFQIVPSAFTGVRFYRVRYITESANGAVLLRSEPSTSVTFSPSGNGTGALVTRPALLGEAETHWELEASLDNSTFYRIATVPIATTTAIDTQPFIQTYEPDFVLSEVVGTYLTQVSSKFLTLDGDRLIQGGHWSDPARQSMVWWSPVGGDPGVGNDERVPITSNNSLNLDNYTGGPLTGICTGGYGTWYAFKWGRIYMLTRTGVLSNAYVLSTLSTTIGAVLGSLVPGIDEVGNPVVFFLDPTRGPARVGTYGIQLIQGLRGTWNRVNLNANYVIARGYYYPYKQQVHWKVAVDGAGTPNLEIVLQVSEIQYEANGAIGRGFTLWNGLITQATCCTTWNEPVVEDGIPAMRQRPYMGLAAPYYVQRGDADQTTDAGVPYIATITTKPYIAAGLQNRWGVMRASLLAQATTAGFMQVNVIRDYGLETNPTTINFHQTPAAESAVLVDMDALVMSGARLVQFQFTDPVASA